MTTTTVYDFTSGAGFTYDPTKIGFNGTSASLLDQRPPSATFYAAWSSMVNANWSGPGNGSLVVTANNGAAVSGAVMNLVGYSGKKISWSPTGNCDFAQQGTLEFQYIPAYSGTPTYYNQSMIMISQNYNNATNQIMLSHLYTTGHLSLTIKDQSNAFIVNAADLGAWSPVAGTTYTILLQVDITNGASQIFINGVQQGATQTGTGIRLSSNILWASIGIDTAGDANANFSVANLTIYSAIVTPASASWSPTIYPTSQPTIYPTLPLSMDLLQSFAAVSAATGSDGVQFYLLEGSTPMWWSGAAWAVSNGTYAQTNPAAVIVANAGTLLAPGSGAFVTPVALLNSATGTTTPSLTSVTIVYQFFGQEPAGPNTCRIFGYVLDPVGNGIAGAVVSVQNPSYYDNQGWMIAPTTFQATTNAEGYFYMDVGETTTANVPYAFSITPAYPRGGDEDAATLLGSALIPNQPSVNFATLTFS